LPRWPSPSRQLADIAWQECAFARRIHDRQLTPFQPVGLVRINLVHHVDEGPAARDEDALLAITGKTHVIALQREGRGHGDRFLAGRLHVKARLALTLGTEHAFVKRTGQRHRAEQRAQSIGVQTRVPRADCPALVIENTHQAIDHIAHRACVCRTVGTWRYARRQHFDV
jgi:hypothetical protein